MQSITLVEKRDVLCPVGVTSMIMESIHRKKPQDRNANGAVYFTDTFALREGRHFLVKNIGILLSRVNYSRRISIVVPFANSKENTKNKDQYVKT